jgi:signal peptidase I
MSEIIVHPRKPGIALSMSLLLPGLGQLYNGQLNKGLLLFMAFAFVSTPLMAMIALWLPAVWLLPMLLAALLLTFSLFIFGLIDAWRTANRSSSYRLQSWQQPGVYLALLLFGYLVVLVGSTQQIRSSLVESFRIPSSSMEPTLLRGDFLFADKRVNCPGCKHHIQRGDLAIFVYPNDRTKYYIKRIIGLPGDEIQIENRQVKVNGDSITRTVQGKTVTEGGASGNYQVHWPEGEKSLRQWKVPQGQVFVLGDNRNKTSDSRKFGTIPLRDVVGRATQIWFSYGRDSGVRWSRMGVKL